MGRVVLAVCAVLGAASVCPRAEIEKLIAAEESEQMGLVMGLMAANAACGQCIIGCQSDPSVECVWNCAADEEAAADEEPAEDAAGDAAPAAAEPLDPDCIDEPARFYEIFEGTILGMSLPQNADCAQLFQMGNTAVGLTCDNSIVEQVAAIGLVLDLSPELTYRNTACCAFCHGQNAAAVACARADCSLDPDEEQAVRDVLGTRPTYREATADVCDWDGVVCDGGHVTGLKMTGDTTVQGDIANLARLPRLERASFSQTLLHGDLSSIGSLPVLGTLQLADTPVTGDIEAVKGLPKLAVIVLAETSITGDVANFVHLQAPFHFDIHATEVYGDIGSLAGLTSIAEFYIEDTHVGGDLKAVSKWTSMHKITFARTKVTGDLAAFADISLTSLTAEETSVGGDVGALSHMTKMTELNLEGTNVDGKLDSLAGLTKLRELKVSHCPIGGDVAAVSGMADLETLQVSHTRVGGELASVLVLEHLLTIQAAFSKVRVRVEPLHRTGMVATATQLVPPTVRELDLSGLAIDAPIGDVLASLMWNDALIFLGIEQAGVDGDFLLKVNFYGHPDSPDSTVEKRLPVPLNLQSLNAARNAISYVGGRFDTWPQFKFLSLEGGASVALSPRLPSWLRLDLRGVALSPQPGELEVVDKKPGFTRIFGPFECFGPQASQLTVDVEVFAPEDLCRCTPGHAPTTEGNPVEACAACPKGEVSEGTECTSCPLFKTTSGPGSVDCIDDANWLVVFAILGMLVFTMAVLKIYDRLSNSDGLWRSEYLEKLDVECVKEKLDVKLPDLETKDGDRRLLQPPGKLAQIQACRKQMMLLTRRLRFRSRSAMRGSVGFARSGLKTWTEKATKDVENAVVLKSAEADGLKELAGFTAAYLNTYAATSLQSEEFVVFLAKYLRSAIRKFRGVYLATKNDVVEEQRGYADVIKAADNLAAQADGEVLKQPIPAHNDIVGLMQQAAIAQERTSALAQFVAHASKGTSLNARLKDPYRIVEKMSFERAAESSDAQGVPSVALVCDVARESVKFARNEQMHEGILLFQKLATEKHIQVRRVKNRFKKPTDGGWADVLVNFSFLTGPAAGHVCEVQMVHEALLAVRSNMGAHHEYAMFRAASEILELGQATNKVPARARETQLQASALDAAEDDSPSPGALAPTLLAAPTSATPGPAAVDEPIKI